MSRVICQTGTVQKEVTLTLKQGPGLSYTVTFEAGTQITLVVVNQNQAQYPPSRPARPANETEASF